MKRLLACMLLAIGLAAPTALLARSEARQLLARSVSAAAPLQLSSEDRAWLQRRQYLVLGSSRPDYPPFELNASQQDYEGISADYAGIIAELLGIHVEVRRFDSRHEAIAALREGSIDLLGSSNAFEAADAELELSTPYADDLPVIVTREGSSLKNQPDLAGLRLAMVDHYLPASTVRGLYPKAQLSLYRSTLPGWQPSIWARPMRTWAMPSAPTSRLARTIKHAENRPLLSGSGWRICICLGQRQPSLASAGRHGAGPHKRKRAP